MPTSMENQKNNLFQQTSKYPLRTCRHEQQSTPKETADTTPSGDHPRGTEKLSFDSILLIDTGTAHGVPSATHGRSVDVGFCDVHNPVPDFRCLLGLCRCDGLILNSYGLRRKLKLIKRMTRCRISVIGPVAVMVKATNALVHNPSRIHGKPQCHRYVGWLCLPRSSAIDTSRLATKANPLDGVFQMSQTAQGDMT